MTKEELEKYCEKLENLILDMEKSCLCERGMTGFDYHEIHPKLGHTSGRWLTPSALLDLRIGFVWNYEQQGGCCDSWKKYKFKFAKQKEGFV